ncbi:MAG TPA: hypothetical protein VH592_04210 [Gemmataceae bacterium]|jgi:hypothetical protein
MSPTLARRLASIWVLTILSAHLATDLRADDKKKTPANAANVVKGKAAEELISLKLEVDALEKLYNLELNAKQLKSLLSLAEKTAGKAPASQEVEAGEEYRTTLQSLHDALVAQQEERIREMNDKLDELQEKESVSIDATIEMTEAAMAAAPKAFRLLSAAQIVSYLASLNDEIPDPAERILSALEEGSELAAEEWKELRDQTAEEISWLVEGLRMESATRMRKTVTDWLDRNHRFQGAELTKQWPALEKSANQLVGNVSSLLILQHYMERELAELLSNPRTAAALQLSIKQEKE